MNGHAGTGALFGACGNLVNGSSIYKSATIQGGAGVKVVGAAGAITNYGTILGTHHQGVVLFAGGNVTNGAVTALIEAAFQGVGLVDTGTVANDGTIEGTGAAAGDTGVQMNVGGTVINGAASDTSANDQPEGKLSLLHLRRFQRWPRRDPRRRSQVAGNVSAGDLAAAPTHRGDRGERGRGDRRPRRDVARRDSRPGEAEGGDRLTPGLFRRGRRSFSAPSP